MKQQPSNKDKNKNGFSNYETTRSNITKQATRGNAGRGGSDNQIRD